MSDTMTLSMLLMLKDAASGGLGKFTDNVKKTSQQLIAMGESMKQMGNQMLGFIKAPIREFVAAEDAATQLRVSMMDSSGAVSKHFEAVNKLATGLGGKLPGTVADFQRMMTVLNQNGIEGADILNGVGEAAGYLAVQLQMPFDEAAKLASKLKEATGTVASDMVGLMDTIQRTVNLGVDPTEMQYAFGRSAGAMKAVGMQGLESAQQLSVMFAQLIKTGLSGETVGTNMAAMLENLKKFEYGMGDKAKGAQEQLKKLGLEMKFFDKAGEFVGPRKMIAQFEQLKALAPEVRTKLIDAIFGGGQDSQMINTLMLGGVAEYDKMSAKMKAQADLQKKVNEQLGTLKNVWEAAEGAFIQLLVGIGAAIAPELKMLAEMFGNLSEKIEAFTSAHPKLTKFAAGIFAIGGGALVAGGSLAWLAGAALNLFGPLGGAVTFVSTRFMGLWSALLKLGAWNAAAGAKLTAGVAAIPGKIAVGFWRGMAFITQMPGRIGAGLARMGAMFGAFRNTVMAALRGIPGMIRGIGPALATKAAALRQSAVASVAWVRANLLTRAGLRGLATTAWGRIVGGLRAVAMGFRTMGMAALANPVGLIIVGIAAAALLIYKYWRPITGFFKGVWQGLKQGLAPVLPAFKAAFAPLAPLLRPLIGAVRGVWNWFKNLIKPVDDIGGKSQAMGVKVGQALAKIINKVTEVVSSFVGLVAKFTTWGSQMMSGLLSGITSGAAAVIGKVKEIAGSIKSAFTGLMGIKSPSRVFLNYGQMLGAGLELGMDAKASSIASAANRMAKSATPRLPALAVAGGPRAGAASGGLAGGSITFAPVIQISAAPGQSTANQVQQAVQDLYPQFVQLMRRYEADQRRTVPA